MKRIGLAVAMYAEDWDGRLPPRVGPLPALEPYMMKGQIVRCPSSKHPFRHNASLGAIELSSIGNPASTWLFRDEIPHRLRRRERRSSVVYADGGVRSVTVGKP